LEVLNKTKSGDARLLNGREFAFWRKQVRGRKPKKKSRAPEFRQRLVELKETPAPFRPSLRALARELATSPQLLTHFLSRLEEWRRVRDLERLHTQAKKKNVTLTPADERHYLAWVRKIERRQAIDAIREAQWASEHTGLLDRIR
jgi:hypothetical protein